MRWIPSVLFIVILGLPVWAGAQTTGDLELPEGADVRIIVDISGSMKNNDPDNLRQPAVRLLARMLPPNAYAGLWTFGQYVNMLVPRDRVNDSWRQQMINRSAEINSVALRTNLGKAIEVASDEYYTDGNLANTDFILLTDGKVDISDDDQVNQTERARILGPLLDDLVAKGATFHSVALSGEADVEFLQALARNTGGSYSVAPSADALNRAFLKALNAAVPQEQVPIEGNRFSVDSAVREFTALIFWGEDETSDTRELRLTDPDGNVASVDRPADSMRWAREAGYDLITVTDPGPGEWRLNGELGEGSRVTVVSDLRMVVSPLLPVFSEEEPLQLEVAFFEDQAKLTDQKFLDVLDVRVTITSKDGRSGTKVLSGERPPENGIYRDTVERLPSPGEYIIDVVADGKTFSRKFSGVSRFDVLEGQLPAPSAEPMLPEAVPPVQESAPDSDTDSVPEADQPEPSKDNSSAGPIDIDAVEEPGAVPVKQAEADTALPLWGIIGGGIVLIGLIAGGVFAVVRRKKKEGAESPDSPDNDEVPVNEEAEDSTEEFGLEDFDLSEFDDLPDTDKDDEEPKP
ncbi:MAG: vWA domain-containing protein [Marinobacter sp.]